MKTTNKVVLIGAGAVGTSFLYSAINQGIAEEYGIIDVNVNGAEGNKMDLDDAQAANPYPVKITSGGYEQVSDADILVITAGRPQKEGETRLEMVEDNARIMKSIADEVVKNGFKGITVIASNPVDVLTTVYQEVTGFDKNKVISSSCSLDSLRLKVELAEVLGVSSTDIGAFVLGEHGDSSVSTLEYGTIMGIPFKDLLANEAGLSEDDLKAMHKRVWRKAYEIIERKRATFYGIGAALADIVKAILRNEKRVFATGAYLSGEYGESGVYAGVPSVLGSNGIIRTYEFPLSEAEKEQFKTSVQTLKEVTQKALEVIK